MPSWIASLTGISQTNKLTIEQNNITWVYKASISALPESGTSATNSNDDPLGSLTQALSASCNPFLEILPTTNATTSQSTPAAKGRTKKETNPLRFSVLTQLLLDQQTPSLTNNRFQLDHV